MAQAKWMDRLKIKAYLLVFLGISTAIIGLLAIAAPVAGQEDSGKRIMYVIPRGEYVRQAINDEGTVVVGYRTANLSLGGEWMLLEVAMTVLSGNSQTIKREQFTLETPDGEMLRMATQTEAQSETATLKALNHRADIQREPLNYLPREAQVAAPMSFFSDPAEPGEMAFDQFGASSVQGRYGRIFFKIPGGITYGRYVLHLELAKSTLFVPVDIMTKEELKEAKRLLKEYEKEQKKIAKEEKKKAKGGS